MLRREAGPSRKLINPFFFWLRGVRIYLCSRAWLTRTDAQQEVDRDHLSASWRNLSGQVVAGAADWPALNTCSGWCGMNKEQLISVWSQATARRSGRWLQYPTRSFYTRTEPFECRITLPGRQIWVLVSLSAARFRDGCSFFPAPSPFLRSKNVSSVAMVFS